MAETSMKPREVDLDHIMEDIGKVGKYQVKLYLYIMIPVLLGSIHSNNYIFTALDTKYRCFIPECEGRGNDFDSVWLENATSKTDRCNRYAYAEPNLTHTQESFDSCPQMWFDKHKKIPCTEFVFESNNTFVEEMDIPCRDWERTLIGTMHSLGMLLALPFVGIMSDKFGRRSALIITGMLEGILGIVKSLSINYPMFAAMEFLEPALGSGVHSSAYILALELLLPPARVAGTALINVYFSAAQAVLGALALFFPYWRTLLQVMYAPSLLMFLLYFLMAESNRWLLSKRKYKEVIENLKDMAKSNDKILPEVALEDLKYNMVNVKKFKESDKIDKKKSKEMGEKKLSPLRQAAQSKIILIRVLKCAVWWSTCTFCFNGLAINSVALAGNIYGNFMIAATIEIPGDISAYFALSYFGRRKTMFTSFFMAGVCLLSFAFIPKGMDWVSLTVYLLGKYCVAIAFGSIYLYTTELFPTPLRHSLFATCSMIGRFGSIMAPQVPLLAMYMEHLPTYLFSASCFLSALLMINSPETLNTRLPETIEEAENISSLKKKEFIEMTIT